jgi:ribosomal protein S12 methylthiotransferase accessory factor
MGCHPQRSVALLRALTEAAQSRLTIIAGTRDDVIRTDYDRVRRPELLANDREVLAQPGGRRYDDGPDHVLPTLEADVAVELSGLARVGVEQAVAVDLSRPELGIAVVRVVVPGLESSIELDGWRPGGRARTRVAG